MGGGSAVSYRTDQTQRAPLTLLDIYPDKPETCPDKHLHVDVYGGVLHRPCDLDTAKVFSRGDGCTVVHPDNGPLLRNKQKRTLKPQKDAGWGTLSVSDQGGEASLVRLHAVWYSLCDILGEAQPWRQRTAVGGRVGTERGGGEQRISRAVKVLFSPIRISTHWSKPAESTRPGEDPDAKWPSVSNNVAILVHQLQQL